jgi:hypothetical protein
VNYLDKIERRLAKMAQDRADYLDCLAVVLNEDSLVDAERVGTPSVVVMNQGTSESTLI